LQLTLVNVALGFAQVLGTARVGFNAEIRSYVAARNPLFHDMLMAVIQEIQQALIHEKRQGYEGPGFGRHLVVLYCDSGRHCSVAAALELASQLRRLKRWQVEVCNWDQEIRV
jgi:RNase adaptor protein for sRNA GlmZ degradation